jgi:hypothetical protein
VAAVLINRLELQGGRVMRDYTMDITKEELDCMISGVSEDGKATKEAEKVILARIKEGKKKDYPKLELKRQLRSKLNAEEGRRVAAVVDRLW